MDANGFVNVGDLVSVFFSYCSRGEKEKNHVKPMFHFYEQPSYFSIENLCCFTMLGGYCGFCFLVSMINFQFTFLRGSMIALELSFSFLCYYLDRIPHRHGIAALNGSTSGVLHDSDLTASMYNSSRGKECARSPSLSPSYNPS